MTAVIASSVALSLIVKSTPARNALMANNTVFQNLKQQIYNTIKISWVKQTSVVSTIVSQDEILSSVSTAIKSPIGLVFASLGWYTDSPQGRVEARHPNGTTITTLGTSNNPTTLANLDVATFNGAVFLSRGNYGQVYAELWIPPAI